MDPFVPFSHRQSLSLIDSEQLLAAWLDCVRQYPRYRYGMRWVTSKGREYLVKVADAANNGKSLGRRDARTEQIHREFSQAREVYKYRLQTLKANLKEQVRLNKALKLGRVPAEPAKIIQAINEAGLTDDLTIIGTHALYAYEALAGVHMKTELLASGDVDLLIDPRKKITISAHRIDQDGLLGLLKNVDRSYQPLPGSTFRAVNDQGFMVDAVMPMGDLRAVSSSAFDSGEMQAVEVPSLQWLVNAPKVKATAIAGNGHPILLRAPDPRAFSIHKAWLSQEVSRDPRKKPRDLAQAKACYDLLDQYLPQYSFEVEHLRFFPKAILDRSMISLADAQEGDDDPNEDSFPSLKF